MKYILTKVVCITRQNPTLFIFFTEQTIAIAHFFKNEVNGKKEGEIAFCSLD